MCILGDKARGPWPSPMFWPSLARHVLVVIGPEPARPDPRGVPRPQPWHKSIAFSNLCLLTFSHICFVCLSYLSAPQQASSVWVP